MSNEHQVSDEMARAFVAKHREIFPGAGWPTLETAKELISAALSAAAKVRAIREGDGEWVMVPREPTQEMIAAGSEARPYIEEGERDELTDRNTEGTYAAMIAASPAATGGEKDNG